jgi:hypothetical protein
VLPSDCLVFTSITDASLLPVHLALVDVHDTGTEWLQHHALGQHVSFQLLAVNSNGILESQVMIKQVKQ